MYVKENSFVKFYIRRAHSLMGKVFAARLGLFLPLALIVGLCFASIGRLGSAQSVSSDWKLVEEPSSSLKIEAAVFALDEGIQAIGLRIKNTGKEQIVIIWTRCNIIRPDGGSEEVMWDGPDTVPPNAYIVSIIAPSSGKRIQINPDEKVSVYLVWRDARREYQGRWTWISPLDVAKFTLSLHPREFQLKPGKLAQGHISIRRLGGGKIPVQLWTENVPNNVHLNITPKVTTGSTCHFELNVSADATPNTYKINVVAEAAEYGFRHSTELTLVVLQPTFTMTVSPKEVVLVSGEEAIINIKFARETGLSDPISLKLDAIPPGVGARFDPFFQIIGDEATLTLVTTPATPFGIYTINIVATAGNVRRFAPIEVIVIPQEMVGAVGLGLIVVGASVLVLLVWWLFASVFMNF